MEMDSNHARGIEDPEPGDSGHPGLNERGGSSDTPTRSITKGVPWTTGRPELCPEWEQHHARARCDRRGIPAGDGNRARHPQPMLQRSGKRRVAMVGPGHGLTDANGLINAPREAPCLPIAALMARPVAPDPALPRLITHLETPRAEAVRAGMTPRVHLAGSTGCHWPSPSSTATWLKRNSDHMVGGAGESRVRVMRVS
jgi:hypothetical protein